MYLKLLIFLIYCDFFLFFSLPSTFSSSCFYFVFQLVIRYAFTHLAQKIRTARDANRGTTISVPNKISCSDGITHVTIIFLRRTLFGEHDFRLTIQGLRKRLAYKNDFMTLVRDISQEAMEMQVFS